MQGGRVTGSVAFLSAVGRGGTVLKFVSERKGVSSFSFEF